MNTIINFGAIKDIAVNSFPYPYFGIECSLNAEHKQALLGDFPALSNGGSYPLDSIEAKGSINAIAAEFDSEQFRNMMAEKFEVDLTDKPLVITARGYSRQRDGQNHTDSKTKLITILLYLNDNWDEPTGRLRILNSNNIDDSAAEFSSTFGQMIAFKVTDNCWHGYVPFEGKRQSLQVNYLVNTKYNKHHVYRHKISAAFKKLFRLKS